LASKHKENTPALLFDRIKGYPRGGEKTEPVVKVHRLYHRNDPIITASPEYRPTARAEHCYELLRAAYIRDQVEKAGVPDLRGVASYCRRFLTVVSIKQCYPGHARQAGLIASQCQGGASSGRYVVVVDDDIDVYDISDVLWAMCSRSDPVNAVEIIRRCWSGPLDPIIPKNQEGVQLTHDHRCLPSFRMD
jgi:4-hydroxy-3-polyprenylbenzoate decarboxylase